MNSVQRLGALCAIVAAGSLAVASSGVAAFAQTPASPAPVTTPGANGSAMPMTTPQPTMNGGQIQAPAAKDAPMPTSDADFVAMAAMSNRAETQEGRLASRRSKNQLVLQFAQHMIDDHTTAQVELEAVARKASQRYPVPAGISPDERTMIQQLTATPAAQFDTAYMQEQVPDHQNAVALFTWEVNNGKDPIVKDYATRTLPAVKNHLAMAQAFLASNGQSLAIDAAGLKVGAGGAGATGVNPPPGAPNGTPANNSAVFSNGQTNGTGNPATSVNRNGSNAQNPSPQQPRSAGPGATGAPVPTPT